MNSQKTVALNDLHVPYFDKKIFELILSFLKDYQPDEVFLLGDIIDFWMISKFRKDPSRVNTIQKDLDTTRELLRRIRVTLQNAKITFLYGNHEARLKNFIFDKAPQLSNIKSLHLPFLLGLDELAIKHIDAPEGFIKRGDIVFTHGTVVSQDSAMTARRMLKRFGISVMHGHSHRGGSTYTTNLLGIRAAWENFCLCKMDLCYEWGYQIANWQQGFSTIDFIKNRFYVQQIPITKKKFVFGGRLYE